MKVLFLGELVSKAGLESIRDLLRPFKKKHNVDFVIANAEGITSGYGIGVQHAMTLFKYGIDVLTGGEKIFFKLDMQEFINKKDKILRPINYPESAPGRGYRFYTVGNQKVFVMNLMGLADMASTHLNNPFNMTEYLIEKAKAETPFIFVQFHASTTAEKLSMGYDLNGKVSAVIGTHTKVLSADAKILDKGTAYISDNGRCGAFMSVGGFKPENEIMKALNSVYIRSFDSMQDIRMQGVLVEFNSNGKATDIQTINIGYENVSESLCKQD